MIVVGRIGRSIGIRGELRLLPLTDDPKRFTMLKKVFLGISEEETQEKTIGSIEYRGENIVVKFVDVDSRNHSELFVGMYVFVPETLSVQPQHGKHFVHDIIGLKAVSQTGEELGVVVDILELPAQHVWVIKNANREVLIPAVTSFIERVDLAEKKVVINVIEGLLEE
jgi:16S rRNA processing protein RimM